MRGLATAPRTPGQEAFDRMDLNHDGVLDREEWQYAQTQVLCTTSIPISPSP